jgi:Icc-related predicted phosphoesterase
MPRPFEGELPPFREGGRFAVVGDLQRTSLLEFWRESNDAERGLVVAAIARARPAFLAIVGDLVFDGSSARSWAEFDALTAPLRDAGIPTLAAFGNHEYWGGRGGERHFFARFPGIEGHHWYTVDYGPLRFIVLDSNIDKLPAAAWERQVRWYEEALAAGDRAPEVRGVVVLLHHPPYTNSTVTGDEPHVQRFFVPPFLRAHKTLAMVSGHVHSYERFARAGKTFLVSGGGGGPRAKLATGSARRHPDDLFPGPALRDFNFLLVTVTAMGFTAEVLGLPKEGKVFKTIDRFSMPFALSW